MKSKFLKRKTRNRHGVERRIPLTLVMGMHYDEGAVIITDSRIMEGADYRTEQKLFYVTDKIVLSSSGFTDVSRQLIDSLQSTPNVSNMGFRDLRRLIEAQQKNLYYWYKGTDQPTFGEDQILLQAIIGSNTEGRAKLLILHENGFTEEITTFKATGDGSRHANNILRNLHRMDINKERALQIGIHTLIQTASIDAVVDANPQAAVIENGNCKIVNYNDGNTRFSIESPELIDIKKKINGIANKQTKVFELMLNGSEELKQTFINLLEEYKTKNKSTS